MSDNDSEFEDFEIDASPPDGDAAAQMEEDDDLVGASSPAHGEGDDDDEDEYDAPEEDVEEEQTAPPEKTPPAKDSGKKKAVASAPASAPSAAPAERRDQGADQTDAKDLDAAYVMRNNVAYMVGLCPKHDGPGRVRDFGDVIVVEDDSILGTMHLPKNWPAAASFPPTAICVVKAKHTAEDELRPVEDEGPFAWYARVVTKMDVGKTPRKNSNKKILKLIPKKVVQSLIKYLSEHNVYNRSSLIQKYQPAFENSKAFPVNINGWAKCPGIKSTGVAPKKETPASPVKTGAPAVEASDDEDLENEAESAEPREQGSPSAATKPVAKAKAPAPSPAASEKKKPAAAPAPAPEPVKKPSSVPRKGGMLNFAKPTKPVAETAPAPAPTPAPTPEPAAPVEKAVSAPAAAASKASAQQDKPTKPVAAKSSNEGASGLSAGQKRPLPTDDSASVAQDVAFKRVRTLVVNDAEKSVTFWKGNTLYIAEL
jgi:hypothetical protein